MCMCVCVALSLLSFTMLGLWSVAGFILYIVAVTLRVHEQCNVLLDGHSSLSIRTALVLKFPSFKEIKFLKVSFLIENQ